jgi:hypothetical protein
MDIYEFNRTFKRGDILRIRDWLLIYYSADESAFNGYHAIAYTTLWHMYNYEQVSVPGHPSYGIGWVESEDNQNARHANNVEKEILYNKLLERGYKWDEERRELIKL